MITLHVDMAARPNLRALLDGEISPSRFRLHNCGPRTGMERGDGGQPFDVREMSLVDYLQARTRGEDWVMLPAVVLGRFHHAQIITHQLSPLTDLYDLAGSSIAVRWPLNASSIWTRIMLHDQYGADPGRVRWVYQGGAGSQRDLSDLVLSRDVDAAVPMDPRSHPDLRTVITDPKAAVDDWVSRFDAAQINHVVVVRGALSRDEPALVQELYAALKAAKATALAQHGHDCLPFGTRAIHRSLEMFLDGLYHAGLLVQPVEPDNLYDQTTRMLD